MRIAVSILIGLASTFVQAQEPVKHIDVFVVPYYRATESPYGNPQVAVARAFDERLSSDDPARIKEVEAEIRAKPDFITPMTMMVLSIRLYDMGFRDEAVFWHYAAKDRMRTISEIVSGGIAGAIVATRDFAATAGPTINGYAFCDLPKQGAIRQSAFEWVRDNPYQAIFSEQLPSRYADRAAALNNVVASIERSVHMEADFLSNPVNRERLEKARSENGAQKKYCW